MPQPIPSCSVTQLLGEWTGGDRDALNRLMPLVYDELHHLAQRQLARQQPGHTLQPTALVHEAFLRLVKEPDVRWQNRAHFLAISARIMRFILVDHYRGKRYAKRGGGNAVVTLDSALAVSDERGGELLALDDALRDLEALDLRKSRLAELRFFAGLTVEETAEVLEVSTATVTREWRLTRAWLHRALTS